MAQFISKEVVRRDICSSLSLLLDHDRYLFESGCHERSVTHHMAKYLEQCIRKRDEFKGFSVDCEYNRQPLDSNEQIPNISITKTNPADEGKKRGPSIYPDIIVHRRGPDEGGSNLLVVEAKKKRNGTADKKDIDKLKRIVNKFKYRFAMFIRFDKSVCEFWLCEPEEIDKIDLSSPHFKERL